MNINYVTCLWAHPIRVERMRIHRHSSWMDVSFSKNIYCVAHLLHAPFPGASVKKLVILRVPVFAAASETRAEPVRLGSVTELFSEVNVLSGHFCFRESSGSV